MLLMHTYFHKFTSFIKNNLFLPFEFSPFSVGTALSFKSRLNTKLAFSFSLSFQ